MLTDMADVVCISTIDKPETNKYMIIIQTIFKRNIYLGSGDPSADAMIVPW